MNSDDELRTSASWTFDGMGPYFDAHVAKHLPGYADVQALVGRVAEHVLPPTGAVVADLGASTGRSVREVLTKVGGRVAEAHLYDADRSMLEEAVAGLGDGRVTAHHVTLPGRLSHAGAHLTLALWLLQFLEHGDRLRVLTAARGTASRDGAILVATKTRTPDSRWELINVDALDDYKAEQGVDAETRAAKTRAIRGVMRPPTTDELAADLLDTGWASPYVLWRWQGWTVMGAWAFPSYERSL